MNKKRTLQKSVRFTLIKSCGQSYQEVVIVGLLSLKGGLVAYCFAAFVTAMNNDISLFRVGQGLYGTENALTVVCSVAGIDVNVQRAKAKRTVIS